MFENNFVVGACLFLVSVGILFNKRQQAEAVKPNLKSPSMLRSALIDLKLPSNEKKGLQNMLNDEILSKSVTSEHQRYYVCVHSDGKASKTALFDYISSLYSKMWNEAVLKNCLGMDCVVVSDELRAGLVTREKILTRPDLCTVFTDRQSDLSGINLYRTSQGSASLQLVDSAAFNKTLNDNLLWKTKISFFDEFSTKEAPNPNDLNLKIFDKVALGGTFDQIHYGHRKLLTLAASSCSELLTVGVTGDSMLSKKSQANRISSFNQRYQNVHDFLQLIKPDLPVNIVELSDPFGPTIVDPSIKAIVVSSETINGAFKINSIRREKNMSDLEVLVTYRSDAAILSSSFIRDAATR